MCSLSGSITFVSCSRVRLCVHSECHERDILESIILNRVNDRLSGTPGNVGTLKHVRKKSGIFVNSQEIIRQMSPRKYCHGKVSQNCSLLVEYLHSYGYLLAFPSKTDCIATYTS